MTIKRFCLLVIAVAALAIGGCGGSDDDASDASDGAALKTSSLSKADYLKQANGICKKTGERFQAQYSAFVKGEFEDSSERLSLTAKLFDNVIGPTFTELIKELRGLGAPAGDEQELGEFVDVLQQELDRADADPGKALKQLTPFPRAAKLATDYGLTECSNSFGA